MRSVALLLPLVLGLGLCRPAAEPEPRSLSPALESLRAHQYDPRYGLEYWTRRLDRRESDPEWDRALDFCREHDAARYPNCRTVELLETASKVPGFPRQEARP